MDMYIPYYVTMVTTGFICNSSTTPTKDVVDLHAQKPSIAPSRIIQCTMDMYIPYYVAMVTTGFICNSSTTPTKDVADLYAQMPEG